MNYESPFLEWSLKLWLTRTAHSKDHPEFATDDPHYCWYRAREDFAATGNKDRLNDMLTFVTMDNPPFA